MKFLVTGGGGFIGWRVARNILGRAIPVVLADCNVEPRLRGRLERESGTLVSFVPCDVAEFVDVERCFRLHPDITHVIHLAYLMSAEVEENPHLGVSVNVLGMVNLFEAAANHRLERLIFTSSETVYGASQRVYGERPVKETDYCAPSDHFFTYGVMKILNEFMAEKYIRKHGISLACARPPVVFGHGRKRGAVLWAEQFFSLPAIGKPVALPFSAKNRDCWVYVDDCAEQLVRLALKPRLAHFAYNSTGHAIHAGDLANVVRRWVPDAEITFDESKPSTPLVDDLDGSRLVEEIGFAPRAIEYGVLAHINEARAEASLPPLG
jgi:nucleoside-diphosphate-sugar epimerase